MGGTGQKEKAKKIVESEDALDYRKSKAIPMNRARRYPILGAVVRWLIGHPKGGKLMP